MNKSLYIVIAGIIVMAGFIGYTLFGTKEAVHTAGDDHTDHAQVEAQVEATVAPHEDSGTEAHAH